MTWLKRIGQIILNGAELVAGISPLLKIAVPQQAGVIDQAVSELNMLAGIVVNVEAAGQAWKIPGPEKLKVAGPLVAQIIASSSLMAGKKIANQDAYNQACATIAGGMADLLNSLHEPEAVQSLVA